MSHPSLAHLTSLSDDVGIVQHATHDVPNRSTGYCTDDVSRALIVALAADAADVSRDEARRLAGIYLAFLHDAQGPDGRFRNFMDYGRQWLDETGTPDSNGRAIWSLGYALRYAPRDGWRTVARTLLQRALPHVASLGHVRSQAYAAIGLTHALAALGSDDAIEAALRTVGDDLLARARATASPAWDWFEEYLTYDNARLSEALIRIGTALDDPACVAVGVRTLAWYESVVFEGGLFVPIGNDGWYVRGGPRARYDQQPLEAAAQIDASLVAADAGGGIRFRRSAERALEWFYGANTEGASMTSGGGGRDGLGVGGANANMGAESTLAYLSSALAMARFEGNVVRLAR